MRDIIEANKKEIMEMALANKGLMLCKKFGFEFVDVHTVPQLIEFDGGSVGFDRFDVYIGFFENNSFHTVRLGGIYDGQND